MTSPVSLGSTLKMRELVKLFGTPETRDALGMSQLGDGISNSLFPGTSVLDLGARYLFLVPRASYR